MAKFGEENEMVPDAVPQCLKDLTMVESQMIARAHPVVKTYRKPGGQRHFEGHVISLSQDITELALTLPWRCCTADIPILVQQSPDGGSWEGRQFTVSVARVETALAWLIANNPAYADVRMDISTIAHLRSPDGGEVDVLHLFDTLPAEEEQEDEQEEGKEESKEEGGGPAPTRDYEGVGAPADPDCEEVLLEEDIRGPTEAAGQGQRRPRGQPREYFIAADTAGALSEEQAVRRALERLSGTPGGGGSAAVNYPRSTGPLREDNTPHLASMCFPTLLPTGRGDHFCGIRLRKVSMIDTLTHLMKFADMPAEGSDDAPHYRFASDRTFAYWCLNIRMRAQAKEQTRVFLSRNSEQVELPLGEVGERQMQQLVGAATRWTANISGTDGYWLVRGAELEETVDQLNCPSVFVTNSAAAHHWHDLHRLLPFAGEEPAPGDPAAVRPLAARHHSLIENPHVVDWWVRMKIFNETFFREEACDVEWGWMRAEWQLRASLHIHGCWRTKKEPGDGLAALSRTFLKGFIARKNRPEEGVGSDADGGVPDDAYEGVQRSIFEWLEDVGFTATNPGASAEGTVVDEAARAMGREELARGMRVFDWADAEACEGRYQRLLNASQRHTKCGRYCLKDGRCRFGFPKERTEEFRIHGHPLVQPPTTRPEDWQFIVTPPNVSAQGISDGYVNRHFTWQLFAWGGNVDASPIVDHGMAYKYMVKYASKGESRSRDAQRLLAQLVRESERMDEGDENRLSLVQILRRVLQTCTTRRDMGAQEVMHLLMQTASVYHDLEFVRASTVLNSHEVVGNAEGSGLRRQANLLEGYARRADMTAWAPRQAMPVNIAAMPYSEFAARFRLQRNGAITALTGRNRVVSFRPFASCNPRGSRYHEYCRNSLNKFKAWEGPLWQGWGGAEGELATTDDAVAHRG